ncbi:MAG TPA: hypothetical protein VEV16_10980 [Daejeonella sp.]|nr:hypothetical protein [Daejeonella sp.]
MKKVIKLLLLYLLAFGISTAQAQGILKKIKEKAGQAAEKMINKGGNTDNNNTSNNPSSSKNAGNKTGDGLITTPPNVNENLASAESAYKANSYGEARYSLQQAMLGVEMEIGKKILLSLPETVSGLKVIKADDQVTSTGWGWAGLTIQRKYGEGDKQLNTIIANNSVWMAAINLYLANGGYAQSSGEQQKWKQTKVKGYRAIIEFDESSGYKLSVPLGQTSLIVWEGTNFSNEQDIMNAANSFDIDGIKKTLGEK